MQVKATVLDPGFSQLWILTLRLKLVCKAQYSFVVCLYKLLHESKMISTILLLHSPAELLCGTCIMQHWFTAHTEKDKDTHITHSILNTIQFGNQVRSLYLETPKTKMY